MTCGQMAMPDKPKKKVAAAAPGWWLVTVHFPSSHRSVRRFLVRGATEAIAQQIFQVASMHAAREAGMPFVGPQNRVEWQALRDDGVVELPEARYR